MELLKLTISIVFISIVLNAKGQDSLINLVVNSSFEECTSCPVSYNQVERCIGWRSPGSVNSADYFKPCPELKFEDGSIFQEVSVPYNEGGFQEARTGNAYVGIVTLSLDYRYKEFVQTKLKDSLVKGKTYKVSMFVSLSDTSMYANDRFRFSLTPNSGLEEKERLGHYPYVLSSCGVLFVADSLITNSVGWVKIESYYVANGSEQFLTIDVFKGDMSRREHKKRMKHPISPLVSKRNAYAYYYIDDVSVVEVK